MRRMALPLVTRDRQHPYRDAMAKRTYEDEAIRVHWDSSRCIHVGLCLREGMGVFDVGRRPWVDLSLADTETIVAAIEACPSGALQYERVDGAPGEQAETPTSIVPWPNGPLMVRGEMTVTDRHGGEFPTGPRAALCRCGASSNQPFCDLSHRDSGFRDNPRAPRTDAESPAEVDPRPLD